MNAHRITKTDHSWITIPNYWPISMWMHPFKSQSCAGGLVFLFRRLFKIARYILHKYQWNNKWAFAWKYHIFTRENNLISSHAKRSPSLWLHNKSRHFHWCLFNKKNITCPLVDMNFIFSCSTRYPARSLLSLVRYRAKHSKIKLISTRGYVISFTLGRPVNMLIICLSNYVCMRRPSIPVSKYRDRAGF